MKFKNHHKDDYVPVVLEGLFLWLKSLALGCLKSLCSKPECNWSLENQRLAPSLASYFWALLRCNIIILWRLRSGFLVFLFFFFSFFTWCLVSSLEHNRYFDMSGQTEVILYCFRGSEFKRVDFWRKHNSNDCLNTKISFLFLISWTSISRFQSKCHTVLL